MTGGFLDVYGAAATVATPSPGWRKAGGWWWWVFRHRETLDGREHDHPTASDGQPGVFYEESIPRCAIVRWAVWISLQGGG